MNPENDDCECDSDRDYRAPEFLEAPEFPWLLTIISGSFLWLLIFLLIHAICK